ncbi:MAG: hypothetical protein K8R85_02810 [Bacteroidetes bacterium]|nr:hypothetical protein [Bacteroidota bacterium]
MKITIDNNSKLVEIQEEFTKMFPFLKIEFFLKKLTPTALSPQKLVKSTVKAIAKDSINDEKTKIIITPQMTVSHLEESFNSEYGISIKVYRNSWRVWLETTVTGCWTLEEQNRQGEALNGKITQNNY